MPEGAPGCRRASCDARVELGLGEAGRILGTQTTSSDDTKRFAVNLHVGACDKAPVHARAAVVVMHMLVRG